jgi:hypothetical protein
VGETSRGSPHRVRREPKKSLELLAKGSQTAPSPSVELAGWDRDRRRRAERADPEPDRPPLLALIAGSSGQHLSGSTDASSAGTDRPRLNRVRT